MDSQIIMVVPTNYPDLLIDPIYFHPRISLFNNKTFEEMKESIDKDINNNNYYTISFFSGIGGALENLSQLLDYVKQKEKEGKLTIGKL